VEFQAAPVPLPTTTSLQGRRSLPGLWARGGSIPPVIHCAGLSVRGRMRRRTGRGGARTPRLSAWLRDLRRLFTTLYRVERNSIGGTRCSGAFLTFSSVSNLGASVGRPPTIRRRPLGSDPHPSPPRVIDYGLRFASFPTGGPRAVPHFHQGPSLVFSALNLGQCLTSDLI